MMTLLYLTITYLYFTCFTVSKVLEKHVYQKFVTVYTFISITSYTQISMGSERNSAFLPCLGFYILQLFNFFDMLNK